MLRSLVGLLGGACVLLAASVGHAQCTKDTDCKGDRVCDGGSCVAPALPPAPPAPSGAADAGAAPNAEGAPPPAPAAAPAPAVAVIPPLEAEPAPPPRRRHSTGMMVGGIIMVSFSPIALLAAAIANAEQNACETHGYYFDGTSGAVSTYDDDDCSAYDKTIYGGLIGGLALAGAGIPLIVIGGKKEPATSTATISPWLTPQAAGVGLRLEM